MAKQKIPTDYEAQGVGAETFQEQPTDGVAQQEDTQVETVATDPEPQAQAPQPQQQAASTTEKKETKQTPLEPDNFILGVLKSFPSHQSLYVDKHGGVFTPDTAERIRGGATLYKNPYYKQN